MKTPRFAIAKYASDLLRMEPRNIGIILWSEKGVFARFIGEIAQSVDLRAVRFVNDSTVYERWIKYWRKQIQENELTSNFGKHASIGEPEFLEVLADIKPGNYFIEPCGIVLDPAENVIDLLNHLYERLVEPPQEDGGRLKLKQIVSTAIKRARVSSDYFQRDYPVICPVKDKETERFEFNYAFANSHPGVIMQRVDLSQRVVNAQKIVDSTAWAFEKTRNEFKIPEENSIVIVRKHPESDNPIRQEELLRIVGSFATLINGEDLDSIVGAFRKFNNWEPSELAN